MVLSAIKGRDNDSCEMPEYVQGHAETDRIPQNFFSPREQQLARSVLSSLERLKWHWHTNNWSIVGLPPDNRLISQLSLSLKEVSFLTCLGLTARSKSIIEKDLT